MSRENRESTSETLTRLFERIGTLGQAASVVGSDNDMLRKDEKSLVEQINSLQKSVKNHKLESKKYKEQITSLECEKSSIEEEYNCQMEEKITIISRLERDNDLLKKEEKSLVEQINTLQKTVENHEVESQNYMDQISTLECEKSSIEEEYKWQIEEKITIISRLEKDNLLHREEEKTLAEQIKTLQKRVENLEFESETYKRQISDLESEKVTIENEYRCQLKENTNVSGLVKVDENSNAKDGEESKVKKNGKQLSQVKKTKKVSLPVRQGEVICSLKSILARGCRADFTLKSGGRVWPVHRAILEGKIRHFETLARGAERDEVRLDDVTGNALDNVLNFLYAGEVGSMSVDNLCAIHAAAHKLNLEDLESLCIDYMKKWMGPELVCRALMIANEELKLLPGIRQSCPH